MKAIFVLIPFLVATAQAQTAPPTSWLWNFGDGQTSTEQHPTHTYEDPGVYTVQLIASNEAGSDTMTKVNYIRVLPALDPVWMTHQQQLPLTIAPIDEAGEPAPVDGIPMWTASDTTVIELRLGVAGMSAYAVARGPIGFASVTVTADGDMGPGISVISASVDIHVLGLPAVDLRLEAGPPEEQ